MNAFVLFFYGLEGWDCKYLSKYYCSPLFIVAFFKYILFVFSNCLVFCNTSIYLFFGSFESSMECVLSKRCAKKYFLNVSLVFIFEW